MTRLSKMAGTLTGDQFITAVRRYSRLSQKAQDAARAVLVDGQTFEQTSLRFNASRQQIHQWVTKVFSGHQPPDWVTRTVTLPAPQMTIVQRMEDEAIEQWITALPPVRATR